jgi:hypothetical protein
MLVHCGRELSEVFVNSAKNKTKIYRAFFATIQGDDCGAWPELAAGDPEPDGRQHGADPGRLPQHQEDWQPPLLEPQEVS